jgi:hypothetical protein
MLAGAHSALAEHTGRTFSPRGPLGNLLKEIQPQFTEGEILHLLDKWEHELQNGGDQALLTEMMQESNVPTQEIPSRLAKISERTNEPGNYDALFVRYAIGEIIEAKVGRKQKKLYWKALVAGDVS